MTGQRPSATVNHSVPQRSLHSRINVALQNQKSSPRHRMTIGHGCWLDGRKAKLKICVVRHLQVWSQTNKMPLRLRWSLPREQTEWFLQWVKYKWCSYLSLQIIRLFCPKVFYRLPNRFLSLFFSFRPQLVLHLLVTITLLTSVSSHKRMLKEYAYSCNNNKERSCPGAVGFLLALPGNLTGSCELWSMAVKCKCAEFLWSEYFRHYMHYIHAVCIILSAGNTLSYP